MMWRSGKGPRWGSAFVSPRKWGPGSGGGLGRGEDTSTGLMASVRALTHLESPKPRRDLADAISPWLCGCGTQVTLRGPSCIAGSLGPLAGFQQCPPLPQGEKLNHFRVAVCSQWWGADGPVRTRTNRTPVVSRP
jgi:hypothetical protein